MPRIFDEKVSVNFTKDDLTKIDARCIIYGCTRSDFIRARCLTGMGGTEYHIKPGESRSPARTASVIKEWKRINDKDGDEAAKLRAYLGIRAKFLRHGPDTVRDILDKMIPDTGLKP